MTFSSKKTVTLIALALALQPCVTLEAGGSMSCRRKAAAAALTGGALLLTAGQFLHEPALHGKHHSLAPAKPGPGPELAVPGTAGQQDAAAESTGAAGDAPAAGEGVPDPIRTAVDGALVAYRKQLGPILPTIPLVGDEAYLKPVPPGSHQPEVLQARLKKEQNITNFAGNLYYRADRLAANLDRTVCAALLRFEENERAGLSNRTRILQDDLLRTSEVGYAMFVEMQYRPLVDRHLRAHLAANRTTLKTLPLMRLFHDIDLMTWCRDTTRKTMRRYEENVLPLIVTLLHLNATEPAS